MKHKIYLGLILLNFTAIAQPVGAPAPFAFNPNQAVTTANFAWYRGGNNATGPAGANNIFGTAAGFNSAIFTQTNGFTRTRLNGDLTTPIQGVNQNVSGYMGLSFNPGTGSFFDNNSPWAMLHLDGPNNTTFGGDWRKWMRTGTFMRENSDAMYVGLKQEGINRSDAVINWSDDQTAAGGPDALRFIFTSTSDGNGAGNLNPRSAGGLNGYEYMRMLPYPYAFSTNSQGTPIGHIGLGPLFGNTATTAPKARLHSHTEDWFENYFQWSNEQSTGMLYNDGLKMGIGGYTNNINRSGHAYIYNQENRSILFSTNHIAPSQVNSSATDAQNTQERMRITSISAPTNLNNGGNAPFGVWNPGGLPNQDVTRVAISHNPATPVTRPLSLLHLGYNTGGILTPTGTDGWRPWMDVGAFISQGTDNAYFGMKIEPGANNDRQDAVISWGDNYLPNNVLGQTTGIDKLRIIFTSPASGQIAAGPGAMSTQDGLEFVRYVPFHNASLAINDPRTGFGDFQSLLPVGTINPGNTVEINSIMNGFNAVANSNVTGSYVGSTGASVLRFRDLTSQSLVSTDSVLTLNKVDIKKVLSVDSLGNVVLINGGGGTADNGLSTSGPTAGKIHLGQSIPVTGNPGKLLDNREVPMNRKNIYFTGQDTISKSAIYIGYTGGAADQGKLNVRTTTTNLNITTAAIKGINRSFYGGAPPVGTEAIGVLGISDTLQTAIRVLNIGVKGVAKKWYPVGVYGEATNNQSGASSIGVQGVAASNNGTNVGGSFTGRVGTTNNTGVQGNAFNSTIGTGVFGASQGLVTAYGGYFVANGGGTNYGIYATNSGNTSLGANYAGYFDGTVFINGTGTSPSPQLVFSDKTIKSNITTISSSLDIISKIKASSFELNNSTVPQLNVESGKTYGFIAQNIETIIPELVKDITVPAKLDSIGNEINPAVTLKSLNYIGIIPFAISGIQELNAKQKEMQTALDKSGLSDTQVKTNINNFNALAKIKTLNPVSYNFTNANVPQLTFKPNLDYGFVAQQLEIVYPELVDTLRIDATYDSLGVVVNPSKLLKTVNYKAMSGLLVRSIQEQQLTIDSLRNAHSKQDSINNAVKQQLASLAALIDGCCHNNNRTSNNSGQTTNNSVDIELSDKDAIVLNQNVPNPFAEQTTITYNVPASVGKAQIIFFNNLGQIIQTVDIKTRGKGKVNVFASDLSSGLYNYTLVADGKVIDSKKMVRE